MTTLVLCKSCTSNEVCISLIAEGNATISERIVQIGPVHAIRNAPLKGIINNENQKIAPHSLNPISNCKFLEQHHTSASLLQRVHKSLDLFIILSFHVKTHRQSALSMRQ